MGPLIGALIPIFDKILGRVIPDPTERAKLQLELAQLADKEAERIHQEMVSQMEVNKAEAGHRSIFVAGWRPACGWVGATGLGYSFILEPLMSWVAKVIFHYGGTFPVLDTASLMVLTTGMLGFGGIRAFEKYNGVAENNIGTPKEEKPKGIIKKIGRGEWPF